MSESLDTRAARAMGWEWIEKLSGWNSKPGNSDATLNDLRTKRDWSPTTNANHFEEMLREIERRELATQYAEFILNKQGPSVNDRNDHPGRLYCSIFAPLPTRVLAACEALEATR